MFYVDLSKWQRHAYSKNEMYCWHFRKGKEEEYSAFYIFLSSSFKAINLLKIADRKFSVLVSVSVARKSAIQAEFRNAISKANENGRVRPSYFGSWVIQILKLSAVWVTQTPEGSMWKTWKLWLTFLVWMEKTRKKCR